MSFRLVCILALVAFALCKNDGNSHDDIVKINADVIKKEDNVFEGDIVMTKKLKRFLNLIKGGKKISPYDAIVNGAWPQGKIPFVYSRLPYASRKAVDQAIAEYNAKTCIRFTPRRGERSYIEFFVGGGCYSMIGRQGGKQQVSLGRGCGTKGVAIHEMMHALGFFHEQSRLDRDRYITINWGNIPNRVRYNFEKYKHGKANTLGEPYDKQSIMHYGNYAFSNNGRKTIQSRSNSRETLGQRRGLSRIDVNQLKKYYKCGGVTATKRPVVTQKPVTGTDCKDKYSLCSTMSKVGLCTIRISWVRDNCKKSCNKCPKPKPKATCKNKSLHRSCAWWKSKGYCTKGVYVAWMAQSCKECGKCR